MRLLFDTDVLLDLMLDRDLFSQHAAELISKVEENTIKGFLCATTVTNIHYLVRKALGGAEAREKIAQILHLFDIAMVNRLVLQQALELKFNDYEDAVTAASAIHIGADAIVTRNTKDYKHCPLPVYSPILVLKMLEA